MREILPILVASLILIGFSSIGYTAENYKSFVFSDKDVFSWQKQSFQTPDHITIMSSDPKKPRTVEKIKPVESIEQETVFIQFTKEKSEELKIVTSQNLGKEVRLYFNEQLIMAPIVREIINNGRVVVSLPEEGLNKLIAFLDSSKEISNKNDMQN